jgi:hypothetical protein
MRCALYAYESGGGRVRRAVFVAGALGRIDPRYFRRSATAFPTYQHPAHTPTNELDTTEYPSEHAAVRSARLRKSRLAKGQPAGPGFLEETLSSLPVVH